MRLQNTRGDIDPRRYLGLSPYLTNKNSIYRLPVPEEDKPWRLQTPFLTDYVSNNRIDPDYYYDYDYDYNIDYTDSNNLYKRSNIQTKKFPRNVNIDDLIMSKKKSLYNRLLNSVGIKRN